MNSCIATKNIGWLAAVGTYFKKCAQYVFDGHPPIDIAPPEPEQFETAQPESGRHTAEKPCKFQPQSLLGRRLTGETQRKLLELLIKKPLVTRRELDDHLGVQNTPDVVMRMVRKCGWKIGKFEYWAADVRKTRKRRHYYYMLYNHDRDIATAMLGMAKG